MSAAPPGRDGWQPDTSARREAETGRRRGPPGRETAAARSTERRVWYGYGSLSRAEKSAFGAFLHDTTRIFGEVAVLGLPALLYVWAYPTTAFYDVTATAVTAWVVMTLVGTLVRGGWIHPLWTDAPGWVTLSPSLLVVRVGYYVPALLVAAFGGFWLSEAATPAAGLPFSAAVAAVSMLAFPRLAEAWLARH